MRVLMLTWEYPPNLVGGQGRHVSELAPALAALGVEVHVVTPDLCGGAAEEEVAPNATVHRVALPDMRHNGHGFMAVVQESNSRLEAKARELHLRLGGFDLIHAHEWSVAYSAVALENATQVPLVVTIHATERGRGQGSLAGAEALAIDEAEGWLTSEAWRVITVSRFMATEIDRYFSIPRDKIDVIHNGVALPAAASLPGDERRDFRRRFACDDEQIVFSVGRLVYEKGLHVLIDAAPEILARQRATKFVVAGAGGQLEALRQRAWERGVYDQFYFTGYISDQDRDRLFQVADVAVFPSIYEPFGIVALEAMAYRCPVVVSATGGLAEVVRLHETGITAHPGAPDSLAWAVVETLRHPEWARARADNAFHEVRQCYTWARIAHQTVDVYHCAHQAWQRGGWAQPAHEQLV